MEIQIKNSTVVSMIRNQLVYDIEDNDAGHSILAMGYVTDTKISIPEIPKEFVSVDAYDAYFVPVTDDYLIIELVRKDNQFATPCWYQRGVPGDYLWVYGSEGPCFSEDVKIVYLLSFDEFEVVDTKVKIVYESETAMQSDIISNLSDLIVAEALTGVNQPDDSLITPEFMDSCDKEVVDRLLVYSSLTSEYIGHSDHTRYYSYYDNVFNSELYNILSWGPSVDYSDFPYSSNEIIVGEMENNTYRTYSSKQTHEEEVTPEITPEITPYNSAPENWYDHPYASFFPELPQGVTLQYVTDEINNDENLRLFASDCTKEKAIECINEFRKIDNRSIVQEIDNEYGVQLFMYIEYNEDLIWVAVCWNEVLQGLFIDAIKE